MTSVINRRSQFEQGVNELNTQIGSLNKKVSKQEAEVSRLNTELDSQKETFEQASTAVKEHDALKESNKKAIENLKVATLDRIAKQKELDELKLKLSRSKKKVRQLERKLKEA